MKEQGQKLAAAGATFLLAEPALMAMHTGGVGALVGLAAAGVAWVIADELVGDGEEVTPSSLRQKKPGTPSLAARLIKGKSERERLPRRSPTFAQMKHLIKPGRDILGFNGTHFIVSTSLKQSINVGLIGLPGSGKTTCLTFHCAQAIVRGAIIRGWDLHGDVAADLGSIFNILDEVEEIVADCRWIQQERDRRIALRKRAKAGDGRAVAQWEATREIFYIIDEFNALKLRLKSRKENWELVTDTLLSLISEGRKFKMRVVLTGQSLPAALFGNGASGTRDNLSTRYAFKTTAQQARTLNIEQPAIESLLPLIAGKDTEGYAILDGGPLVQAMLISIPLTTVDDIRALLDEYDLAGNPGNAEIFGNASGNGWKQTEMPREGKSENISAFPNRPGNGHVEPDFDQEEAETDEEDELPEGLTSVILERILRCYEAGWTATEASRHVRLEGRKYGLFTRACEILQIDFKVKA
ncbi:MAG TPA: hypothetical protein VFN35_12575 [Ktedonobacteraceae bacterium]|nr:hypothetical protein [Ktedonobacteraceae bacterium]